MTRQSNFRKLSSAALLAALAGILPSRGAVTGQWDFNDGSLKATTGQDLEYLDGAGGQTETDTVFGTTTSLGLPDINGQPAHVMGFPRSLPTMGYLLHSNMQPNGGGSLVNQYTLIFDLLYTGPSTSGWRALAQIDDPSNTSDADFFINPTGGIGISGSYQGAVASNAWQRVAISVDLVAEAGPTVRKFINGVFVGQQILATDIDGRWAISPAGGGFGDTLLLFTDNDVDGASEAPGFVNSIQVHDEALSDAYIAALGAPQGDGIPAAVQVPVSFVSRTPGPNAVNIMPGTSVDLTVAPGSEPFEPSSIALKLNGQPLPATVTPEDVNYAVHATLPNLSSRSQNTLQVVWNDPAKGGSVTQEWTFGVAPYELDAELAASLASKLTAYWNLDEGLTNINATNIVDIARGNDSTLTMLTPETTWLKGADAKFGSALYLDGENAWVGVSTNEALNIKTNEVTISAWVKIDMLPSDLPETYGSIFDSVEDNYVLYLDRANQELRFKVTDTTGNAARPGIPQSQLKVGEWMHVVGVYNGNATATAGDARIYLNGQLADLHPGSDSSVGTGLTAMVRAGQIAAMGRNSPGTASYLHGAVDDVAVWSRALTTDEIGYLASGHPLPVTGAVTAPAVLSSRIPAAGAVNVTPETPLEIKLSEGSSPLDTSKIVVRLNGNVITPQITSNNGLVTLTSSLAGLPSHSENTVKVEWTDPALGAVVSDQWTFTMAAFGDNPQIAASLKNSLVAYWNMDEGLSNPESTILEDTAGDSDAMLTLLDPATAWLKGADAKFGSALVVDGANTWADIPPVEALNITNNQVSVSLWVKLTSIPSLQPEGIASIYDSVEDGYVVYGDRGNKELRFKVTDSAGQAARPGIPEALLTTNEWLNVVAVYDGRASATAGEARIYLNGQLADTHVGADSSIGSGLTNIVKAGQVAAIGRNGAQAQSFLNGAVDDVAIWSRALTSDEIGYLATGHAVVGAPSATVSITGITLEGAEVHITWAGGQGNYQLQRRASLSAGTWEDVGTATSSTEARDGASAQSMFYRVVIK